ncbi:MAG: hypothetical protein ACREBH_01195 [Candidatus Micrarchaeaceae archaeon]
MDAIVLKCGCKVEGNGNFIVGDGCMFCKECNAVGELHPFGGRRIHEIKYK